MTFEEGPATAHDANGNPYTLFFMAGGNERALVDRLEAIGVDTVYWRSRSYSRGAYRARLTAYRDGKCVTGEVFDD